MKSVLTARLLELRASGDVAVIPYFAAGYPERDSVIELIRVAEAAGAAAVELGIPFSDPMADGVSIQAATFKALQNGMTPHLVLDLVRQVRAEGVVIPLVLMTYYNPILAYGPEAFIRDAVGAGVDGVITVDLPADEAVDLAALCRAGGLDFVPLIAPTSSDDRIAQACRIASGFVYCVSVAGVTGARRSLPEGLEAFLQRVRKQTMLPLGVGFGISTREHVAALRGKAEAAVVGSAIVDVIQSSSLEELGKRVKDYVEVLTGRTKART